MRALASKAMPVSRSTGRSQPARLRGDAVAARTGTDGTSHWVLTTRTRHRPKVLLTISTSVCSTAAGACWEGAEADRVRWRPRLHHHQPRRAASGAVASKTVATRARLSGRGAGPTSSATRGRLGAFFNLGQMVPIGNRQRAPRRIAPDVGRAPSGGGLTGSCRRRHGSWLWRLHLLQFRDHFPGQDGGGRCAGSHPHAIAADEPFRL